MTALTHENAVRYVLQGCSGVTKEQAAKIADLMVEASSRGENSSAWHNAAKYFGTRCNCASCHPHPGAFRNHSI